MWCGRLVTTEWWCLSLRPRLVTLAVVAAYAIVIVSTNHLFTILDDESTIIVYAGNQPLTILHNFLSGSPANQHPPLSEVILHFWLAATNYSFFMLRVFANFFYIAGILVTAVCARRLAGKGAYWATLLVGFLWPFAFQYGRITGWYCFCLFLLAWLTWAYLRILDDQNHRSWISFGIAAILMVWSNYFGVVLLLLFLADLAIFHPKLAAKHFRSLFLIVAAVAISFWPLVKIAIALAGLPNHTVSIASIVGLKSAIASFGFPFFSVFGSVAVAPWYLPLSIPILVGTVFLLWSTWFSLGRRWLIYLVLSMVLLELCGQLNIKRVLFLLPWLFLAIGISVASRASRYPRLATAAIAVLIVTGWIGIVSGRHYSTTNLYEPWNKVSRFASVDARRGATIVSENFPFFLYLDYQLGLESNAEAVERSYVSEPYLGEDLYRSRGFSILQPYDWPSLAEKLRGEVVLVNGSGPMEQVADENALNDALRLRCTVLGEYHAAPDPAAFWKARYVQNAPILAFRTNVIWYDCQH
jgi:Dolichyl-phosphate-mannose-protein mannosyltransferase